MPHICAVRRNVLVVLVFALVGLAVAGGATPAAKVEKFRLSLTSVSVSCSVPCDIESFEINDPGVGEFRCHPFVDFSQCSGKYPEGTLVILRAQSDSPIAFASWSGACSGSGKCVVTMDSDKTLGASWTTP